MRKWVTAWLAALSLLALGWTVVNAQAGGWIVWLYDSAAGRMTQITPQGAAQDFILPLPAGFDRYPGRVAVGRGGQPFAYIVSNSATFQGQLVVADQTAARATFNLPLTFADSWEFFASEQVFRRDNGAVALGYSLEGGGWGIIVFDIAAGAVTHTLRHDTPLAAALGLPAGFGLTPVVRDFSGDAVTFTLVQAGAGGAPAYDSYTWSLSAGTIAANPTWPGLDSDIFAPTGEVVMALPDDRLANARAAFTFYQANSLHVYDPFTGARFPFYNAPDRTLALPRFIQNGERILVDTMDAAERYRWLVIGRDGVEWGALPAAVRILDARGLPDGFVYTTDAFAPGVTTLVYVNTRGPLNAGAPIWTSLPGAQPVIAWAGGVGAVAQAAATPWAKLADAVYAPPTAYAPAGAMVAPAQVTPLAPLPTAVAPAQVVVATPVIVRPLAPGGLAIVNTTEGDQLNVRLGPGLGFDVVQRLPAGSRVVLLEGPRYADGLAWWKVRTAAGIEGWCVESVEDRGTRLQTLLPG